MARKSKRPAYINPKAPKDISHEGPRKQFKVAPHASIHVQDEDGVVRKYSGRKAQLDAGPDNREPEDVYVYLTESVASYLANRGLIELELDFGAEKDSEIAQLHQENVRLRDELSDTAALRERIAELEAKLAGGDELSSDGEDAEALAAVIGDAESSGAGSPASTDGAEDGAGGDADASGAKSGSGPSSGRKSETSDRVPRRRRKAG